jgi:hypothetical protein
MIAYDFTLKEGAVSQNFHVGGILLLLLDILLNFKTGFFEKGEINMDSTQIKINYYSKKLPFDLLNPLSLIIGVIDSQNNTIFEGIQYFFLIIMFINSSKSSQLFNRIE